jgi:hypothetical protein
VWINITAQGPSIPYNVTVMIARPTQAVVYNEW